MLEDLFKSCLLALPCITAFCLALYLAMKRRDVRVSLGHIIGCYVYGCVIVCILGITGALTVDEIGRAGIDGFNLIPFAGNSAVDIVCNAIMFIPVGFFLPLLFNGFKNPYKTVFAGFLLSLAIEASQIFNFRATDITDLITNTLGALCWYMVFAALSRKINKNIWLIDGDAVFLRYEAFVFTSLIFASNFLLKPLLYSCG